MDRLPNVEVARMAGLKPDTLRKMLLRGTFPKPEGFDADGCWPFHDFLALRLFLAFNRHDLDRTGDQARLDFVRAGWGAVQRSCSAIVRSARDGTKPDEIFLFEAWGEDLTTGELFSEPKRLVAESAKDLATLQSVHMTPRDNATVVWHSCHAWAIAPLISVSYAKWKAVEGQKRARAVPRLESADA